MQVLLHLGESMPSEDIDELIKIADTDGDGEIDCREFMALVLDKPFVGLGSS